METKYEKFLRSWFVIIIVLIPVFASAAWSAPTQPPPTGNTSAPLNTSDTTQIKNGDLSVESFAGFMNGYFAQKLGIGTLSILATLDVTPTITATADLKNIKSGLIYNGVSALTNYYATYIAAPTGTGSGLITNKYALVTEPAAGKVGIGTITPAAQLSVNGGVQMGDDASACTSTNAGTMRWHGGVMEACTGMVWVNASYANPCQPTAACVLTASGGTCTTYSTQQVAYYASCPAGVVSTCSNGTWSPTPLAYSLCVVGVEPIYGCMNSSACNYDSNVNTYDGDASCVFRGDGCESEANNCGSRNSGTLQSDCTCSAARPGDEASCPSGGCTDSNASNYNPDASYDDGSCSY